jgi:hypothetical protein
LDHVGNALRHGLPDAEREWTLEGDPRRKKKKKGEAIVPVRQCPQCFCCHEPAPSCPECGHVYQSMGREIHQEEGELRELTEMEMLALRQRRKMEVARARTREDLERIAEERGYKRGWVENILKFRGGKNAR